jgi:arylsulfatase A-like enzyme
LESAGDRPFFAFVNYIDAHDPYWSEGEDRARLHAGNRPIDRYDAAIATLDRKIGELLELLRTRGLLDRTVVIVTSDHGEQFGEHGLTRHGNSLYLPLLRVPLIIVPPKGAQPQRVGEPVGLQRLPATVLYLAGLDPTLLPGPALPLVEENDSSSGAAPPLVIAEIARRPSRFADQQKADSARLRALVSPSHHYIYTEFGREELYRLDTDPSELRNLVATQEGVEVLAGFRAARRRLWGER